jgi:Rrf2 family nitric oxide-sensitive transcriptional repressor
MRIKTTTNYAIRIVLYLASKKDIATAKEIAQVMNIPVAYELKVTKQLLGAGIIKMYRGVKGGFKLAVAPDKISLFDVINAMDPDLCRNIYADKIEDNYFMHQINLVHSVYDNIQYALNSELRKVSFAQLIENPGYLAF